MKVRADLPAVKIRAGAADIQGMLDLPATPAGEVAFSHGSGSGRHLSRKQYVAAVLRAQASVKVSGDATKGPYSTQCAVEVARDFSRPHDTRAI